MNIVITQPTYLPWMGYFGLIELSDVFVFYDDVQFERRSWQSRNRIMGQAGVYQWLTVPIMHNGQDELIKDIKIDNSTKWAEKHWKSIYHTYKKTRYFSKYESDIREIYSDKYESICDLNTKIIIKLANLMDLSMPRFIYSSDLSDVTGSKTDRLISVLDKIEGENKSYISTVGTKEYLEVKKFKDAGINLFWYDFQHPVYKQNTEEFVPYMSVIDLLFNEGDKAGESVRMGLEGALTNAVSQVEL